MLVKAVLLGVLWVGGSGPLLYSAIEDDRLTRNIIVTGKGEVAAEPDFAVLDLAIVSRARALGEARKDNDERSARVLKATREFRVDPKDVQTSQISVAIEDKYVKEETVAEYVYRKGFRVVVRDFKSFEKVFNGLLDAGVNCVNRVEFDTTRRKEFQDQARATAIKSAHAKALSVAQALGKTLGEPWSLSVNESPFEFQGGMSGMMGGALPQHDPTIAGGQIRIGVEVSVTYVLADGKAAPKPGAPRR